MSAGKGAPSLDDPRRCQAKRRDGKPCVFWALRGSGYCQHHGGRRGKTPVVVAPRIYSRFLTHTLAEMVEEQLSKSPSEQLQLFEELALMRHTASHALVLYDAACSGNKPETKVTAALLLRDSLKEVGSMCESAARVAAAGKDKIPAHVINFVLMQVVKVAYAVFGEDDPKTREFERALREEIRVPGDSDGTVITPDEDVMEMDDTVPRAKE